MVDHVGQHLPDPDALVRIVDEPLRDGRQPRVDRRPFIGPCRAQPVDGRQRLLLGGRLLAGVLDPVPPALSGAELVDEDVAEPALPDHVDPRPDVVRHAIEHAQHAFGRPPVVVEEVADVGRVHPVYPASRRRAGSSVGDSATRKPAASSASTLEAAVPAPPEMIAPAWPIRFPSGAVRPAMKAAFGMSRRGSPAHAAAVSSAAPPISPMRTMASVSSSSANSWRASRNVVPMIGSPPIPTQVDWPSPASVIAWT